MLSLLSYFLNRSGLKISPAETLRLYFSRQFSSPELINCIGGGTEAYPLEQQGTTFCISRRLRCLF
jgi:hypothetical protein